MTVDLSQQTIDKLQDVHQKSNDRQNAEKNLENRETLSDFNKESNDQNGEESVAEIEGYQESNVEDKALDQENDLSKDEQYIQEITTLKYHFAEAQNKIKRLEREKEDTQKYAITNFARNMLSVADNLKRACKSFTGQSDQQSTEAQSFIEGINLTIQELNSVFSQAGIKEINPKGEKFDPHYHQAMFEVENEEHAAGTIIEVMQCGYSIHDRLLRPAMVGVTKDKAKL